jgi:mRNA-degrading endonuclease RelE of RelBE toxin-antitoxin system
LALKVKLTGTPYKYLESLDRPTRERILSKLKAIAEDPYDARLSKPLVGQDKRTSRVGTYRIIFEIVVGDLIVDDIGPRGQVYRNL